MSEEIIRNKKFRLWVPELEKMFYSNEYSKSNKDSGLMLMDMEGMFISINDGSVVLLDECGNYEWFNKEVIKMMYIGRTDKKGEDIYEGDLIDTGIHLGVVYYDINRVQYRLKFGKGHTGELTLRSGEVYGEVKGNKLENPELYQEKFIGRANK